MTAKISIDTKSRKVLIELGRHPKKHKRALRLALNEIGSEVIYKISNYIFNPPKTGRIYTFRGRQHQASAPGESPANRTGRLAKSGGYKVRGYLEMTIYETAPYAGYLELGTKKMAPRPHIIRAIRANRRNAIRSIENHIDRELKR